VLLKITHAPYVAAIWAYEGISDYWFGDINTRGSSSLGGPVSTNSMKRASYLRYSAYTPRTLVAASLTQASLNHASAPAQRSATSLSQRPATKEDDLKSLVLKLSSQVEELTAIVAEQQLGQGKDMDNQSD
jgi:hypothetical protein